MSGLNFFSWIRDGVRQSVLLGVSDAVEQLGTPPAAEEIHPSVAGFLQPENGQSVAKITGAKKAPARKRLGKSLKDLDSSK